MESKRVNSVDQTFNHGHGEIVDQIKQYLDTPKDRTAISLTNKATAYNSMSAVSESDRDLMHLEILKMNSNKTIQEKYMRTHQVVEISSEVSVLMRKNSLN